MAEHIFEFLRLAEEELREQPHKYAALVDILTRDMGRKAIEVRAEVEPLLRDQPYLIYKFNGLLLPELRIPTPEFDRGLAFVLMVKERSRPGDGGLYQSFLHLLEMYRTGMKPRRQATIEISDLLKTHPDLQRVFLDFLPPDVRAFILSS